MDSPKQLGGDRTLIDNVVSPLAIACLAVFSLAVSVACQFTAHNLSPDPSPLALQLYCAGICLSLFYTGPPFPLKYCALGDLTILMTFCPLTVLYATTTLGVPHEAALSLVLPFSLPLSLVTVGILQGNNHRDIDTDTEAGITTVANLLGPSRSGQYYALLLLSSYLVPLSYALGASSFSFFSPLPSSVVTGYATGVLLTAPVALATVQNAEKNKASLDEDTAKLHMLHGVMGCVGMYVGSTWGS